MRTENAKWPKTSLRLCKSVRRLLPATRVLRSALAAAKLETVEAANTITRNEAQLGDLIENLTAKTIECERRSHENGGLREKHLNLSLEFDKALSREAEARRKLDEMSIVHANEAARNAELLLALGNREKECCDWRCR